MIGKINLNHNTQLEMLLTAFPEISNDKATDLDRHLKDRISSLTDQRIQDQLTEELVKEILPSINTKNRNNLKKKCKKVVALYLINERQFMLQENWFCLLAYLISLVSMCFRILNISTDCNDKASFIVYFGALVIWLVLVKAKKTMTNNVKILLDSFNRCAPSMTIVWGLFFYFAVITKRVPTRGLITIVASSLGLTGFLTINKYRSVKKHIT